MINTEKFVERRKILKLSQSDLCKDICTQSTLSKFENQQSVPTFEIMVQLCERLGLTLNDIFPVNQTHAVSQNEQYLKRLQHVLFHQDSQLAVTLLDEADLNQFSHDEQNDYWLLTYFYLVILKLDLAQAHAVQKKLANRQLEGIQAEFFQAITMFYYHLKEDERRANSIFSKLSQQQNQIDFHQQVGLQMGIFYLLAEFQLQNQNFSVAAQIAAGGIDVAKINSTTLFLENFYWQLAQVGERYHYQQIIMNELIESARIIAKIHNNQLILLSIRNYQSSEAEVSNGQPRRNAKEDYNSSFSGN
ncbi:helix-turn-helix domain-containing protein [Fructobacillus tropaeoli]|uniref:helix-turn-helix domain-containing protein n=1 Tax=Fructobacillus tropaeoli TaxID=709323 RepID=UPI001455E83F|nr:helix-turn-helix transcriptional regulator [Fructobacillus tropaeoli]NLS37777.1 helix-turn-helix domain-containing protein [Fructobacillus tropaeoli]